MKEWKKDLAVDRGQLQESGSNEKGLKDTEYSSVYVYICIPFREVFQGTQTAMLVLCTIYTIYIQ